MGIMGNNCGTDLRIRLANNLKNQLRMLLIAGKENSLTNSIGASNFNAILKHLAHHLPDGVFVVQLGINFRSVCLFGHLDWFTVFIHAPILGLDSARRLQLTFLADPLAVDYVRTGIQQPRGWLFRKLDAWWRARRAARAAALPGKGSGDG